MLTDRSINSFSTRMTRPFLDNRDATEASFGYSDFRVESRSIPDVPEGRPRDTGLSC